MGQADLALKRRDGRVQAGCLGGQRRELGLGCAELAVEIRHPGVDDGLLLLDALQVDQGRGPGLVQLRDLVLELLLLLVVVRLAHGAGRVGHHHGEREQGHCGGATAASVRTHGTHRLRRQWSHEQQGSLRRQESGLGAGPRGRWALVAATRGLSGRVGWRAPPWW